METRGPDTPGGEPKGRGVDIVVWCLVIGAIVVIAAGIAVYLTNAKFVLREVTFEDEAVDVTPIEPEWRGKITLEISNTTPLPAKIYANEGIAQLIFLKGDRVCAVSYADKKGKYQDQPGLTLPKVD